LNSILTTDKEYYDGTEHVWISVANCSFGPMRSCPDVVGRFKPGAALLQVVVFDFMECNVSYYILGRVK